MICVFFFRFFAVFNISRLMLISFIFQNNIVLYCYCFSFSSSMVSFSFLTFFFFFFRSTSFTFPVFFLSCLHSHFFLFNSHSSRLLFLLSSSTFSFPFAYLSTILSISFSLSFHSFFRFVSFPSSASPSFLCSQIPQSQTINFTEILCRNTLPIITDY